MLEMLFTTDAMRAAFGDVARVQGMLDFEAGLARAEAAVGVIPAAAALSIVQCCRADVDCPPLPRSPPERRPGGRHQGGVSRNT